MIYLGLSLPSTSHTICIGNNFSPCQSLHRDRGRQLPCMAGATVAPLYRSQLKLINLALVATVPVIEKHGIDAILKPVINKLASAGISLSPMDYEDL